MVTISCPEFFAPENYDNGGSRMKELIFEVLNDMAEDLTILQLKKLQ